MNSKSVSVFLTIFYIFFGIVLLIHGVKDIKEVISNKDLVAEKAVLINKKLYKRDEDGGSYDVIYEYTVDGQNYTISVDYGTSIVPKMGTIKTIKYNIKNPNEAILIEGSKFLNIIVGFLFAIVPIMNISKKSILIDLTPTQQKIYDISIDLVFIIAGMIFLWMMGMCINSFSIKNIFESLGIFAIMPSAFVIFGLTNGIFCISAKK